MAGRKQTVALLVAAGSGSRAGGGLPKQYRAIAGRPVLAHALARLQHPGIDGVQVVIGAGQEALYESAAQGVALPSPVTGGETRQQSVQRGLDAIAAAGGAERVLIHDAARPFLPSAVIDRLLGALAGAQGAVPVLPVVDSLAFGGDLLGDTAPREALLRVQTPQAFAFAAIRDAHRRWNGEAASDDAQVARAAGIEVVTVEGDQALDKLTHAADFERAEQALAARLTTRTGLGFDVHALAAGEELWLGGLLIPHHKGLAGHSDADVVLHAITDALLGAIAAGDIGDHFQPSDPQWRGARSDQFVRHACSLISERGGRIDHVDVTIICEEPRIGPHREAMRASIASVLSLPLGRVGLKATTSERLGFTGRGEGIAAQAVASVRLPEDDR